MWFRGRGGGCDCVPDVRGRIERLPASPGCVWLKSGVGAEDP